MRRIHDLSGKALRVLDHRCDRDLGTGETFRGLDFRFGPHARDLGRRSGADLIGFLLGGLAQLGDLPLGRGTELDPLAQGLGLHLGRPVTSMAPEASGLLTGRFQLTLGGFTDLGGLPLGRRHAGPPDALGDVRGLL